MTLQHTPQLLQDAVNQTDFYPNSEPQPKQEGQTYMKFEENAWFGNSLADTQ